jgi:hypothetical protein
MNLMELAKEISQKRDYSKSPKSPNTGNFVNISFVENFLSSV